MCQGSFTFMIAWWEIWVLLFFLIACNDVVQFTQIQWAKKGLLYNKVSSMVLGFQSWITTWRHSFGEKGIELEKICYVQYNGQGTQGPEVQDSWAQGPPEASWGPWAWSRGPQGPLGTVHGGPVRALNGCSALLYLEFNNRFPRCLVCDSPST